MPKLEWFIGDLHIKKLKTQDTYSVRVRLTDADGKRAYSPARKVKAKSKDQAVAQAVAYQDELLQRTPATLHRTVEAYHRSREVSGEIDELTVKREAGEIKKLFKYFDDVPLSDISPVMVDDTFQRMAEDGVSQHQRAKGFGLLRRALRYAQKHGDIAGNLWDLCDGYSYRGPDPKRKAEKRITTTQLQQFLRELDDEPLTGKVVALYICIHTGFRRGEVLGLEWGDVDFDNDRIHVRRQYGQQHEAKSPKTDSSMRTIRVDPALMDKLRQWHDILLDENNGALPDNSPVCPNMLGEHIDPGNFSRWRSSFFVQHGLGRWATETEWVDKRGVKRKRYSHYVGADMQAIRRASATLLVGAGVDPKTVQARFGHSQIQTTMTYYAEVESGNDDRASDVIGRILSGD